VTDDTPVLTHRRRRLAVAELNRPRALNALTHEMVGLLQRALDAWADDETVEVVALVGAGDRGLCAGGDLVAMHRDARDGTRGSVDFWRDEYVLDHTIATFPKPVVAVMDGVVMGGGVGLSAHARHRVVTDRTRFAMPETRIGFVPDVGGPRLLSHAPGELGTHVALTAATLDGADTLALGAADVLVPAERLAELLDALETEDPGAVLDRLAVDPPASALAAARTWIDPAYAGDDPLAIVERLRASEVPEARAAADEVEARSPTAVALTLAALRRAATLPDLRAALDQDLHVSTALLDVPDMAEGIRAQVIDKDRTPRWSPATLAEVDPDVVRRCLP
jgi:enoyl-CoA hydratase